MAKTETSPENENKRLTALNSYNVLDTLPEKEYDAITRLASYICQVPIALISLIDEDRQWFKSKFGIDVGETPRADAFCNYTILDDKILEINNTLESDLFKDNVFVTGAPDVRFYAGAPLIDPAGHRLGSLCVIDQVPRKLTAEQKDALRTLADEVMSHLLLKKQKQELEESLAVHKDFYRLFNSSPEIHLVADRDSNIELINDAIENVLGYTPQQAIGQSLWQFVVGQNREQFVPVIEKAITSKQAFEIETETITADKGVRWIGWCAITKEGKWYASGRDITYQKKLLAELEQLSLVASKVYNGVIISNANDEVIWTNEAFEKITGYSLSDLKDQRLREVLKGTPTPDQKQKLDLSISKKESYQADLLIHRKDGKPIWISVVNSVVHNAEGKIDKFIRIVIDITLRKNAEKDLDILSFAARKSPSGTLIRDKDGKVIWMNEALERILGYTLEEVRGKTLGKRLMGEESNVAGFDKAEEAVKQRKPYELELKIYRKDGSSIWAYFSNSPLLNEMGEVERQITVAVDITERKAAEEQLKLLSLVASSTTSGVVINNRNGKVEWINSAFEKITGYNINDVKDKHLGDALKGELTDVSIIERARRLSQNKQSFEVDLLAYRKDGQPLWISVINSVILTPDGDVDKYIEVIIDITSKKKVELELIAAKEQALQLNRAKDMFISVMSHEIRTPLNAVIGMSRLLIDNNPLESQKENLDILQFSAENLMTLINDVLDFTKIETGNIELEKTEVNLREMVHRVVNSMQYRVSEKNIYLNETIDESIPEFIIADSARLVQVLLNLVNNAIKFTDIGGVTIDLKVLEETNGNSRIRFAVTDTGIGIANDKLGTIFESFKQAEADTTRKYGGTGLGLAISKRLVELYDSRINVDSVLGQGSTFWFIITFNKAKHHTNTTNDKMEIGLRLNVLVVDDNQINRILVNKVLQKWGTQVDFAENGQEAVDKITSNMNYDVVLMDIHMPVMGGIEATQIIRSKIDAYFQQLPIIALTASMLSSEINQMDSAGMNDFILKPFDPKTLFEKLSKYQKV
ncbi:PAS domain S-box protein [Mucilaginibacter sp. E4BP6]|uniref:PAS domain S-box protein n=1 Tax=Mucilaginibacter sp. E4BP6 TaxID=2723089 RepID=UPI0015CE1E43|nr:PAS domain S-box protein [Mucilaginibacter sp. E4BP6]NYE66696.1 PAS domain S-box-containing protein [Mucilaginibacter sp. E4BP6]